MRSKVAFVTPGLGGNIAITASVRQPNATSIDTMSRYRLFIAPSSHGMESKSNPKSQPKTNDEAKEPIRHAIRHPDELNLASPIL